MPGAVSESCRRPARRRGQACHPRSSTRCPTLDRRGVSVPGREAVSTPWTLGLPCRASNLCCIRLKCCANTKGAGAATVARLGTSGIAGEKWYGYQAIRANSGPGWPVYPAGSAAQGPLSGTSFGPDFRPELLIFGLPSDLEYRACSPGSVSLPAFPAQFSVMAPGFGPDSVPSTRSERPCQCAVASGSIRLPG